MAYVGGCATILAPPEIGGGNAITVSGDDYRGRITFTTGGSPLSYGYFFVLPYAQTTQCVVTPNNTSTASWTGGEISSDTHVTLGHYYLEVVYYETLAAHQTYILNYICD